MQRRDLLRTGGLLLGGGMTTLSGCSGVLGEFTSSLSVTDTDSRVTGFGNVVVTATVTNDSDETQSGTLWARVEIDGGSTYEESVNVIVPANTAKEYRIKLDIDFGESLSASRYSYTAWVKSD
jgi:hypothetical protein